MKKNIELKCFDGVSGYDARYENSAKISVISIDGVGYVLADDGIYAITLHNTKSHTAIATKVSKEKEDYLIKKDMESLNIYHKEAEEEANKQEMEVIGDEISLRSYFEKRDLFNSEEE